MNICRHDLVFLSARGQRYAWEHRESGALEDEMLHRCFHNLPGIYRTQPSGLSDGIAALGFSLPILEGEARRRVAALAPIEEISAVLTPWEVSGLIPCLPSTVAPAIESVRHAASEEGLAFGVFGSAAMQAVTGLPYLHMRSDIDLIIRGGAIKRVEQFYTALIQVEQAYHISFDVELMLSKTCYIKLRELIAGGKTVLAKGGSCPRLLARKTILETMAALPQ